MQVIRETVNAPGCVTSVFHPPRPPAPAPQPTPFTPAPPKPREPTGCTPGGVTVYIVLYLVIDYHTLDSGSLETLKALKLNF